MPREVASNVIALLHVIGRAVTEATHNVMVLIGHGRKGSNRGKKVTLPCSAYLTLLRFLKPLVNKFCAVSMTIL